MAGATSLVLLGACANPSLTSDDDRDAISQEIVESVSKDDTTAAMLPDAIKNKGSFVVSINANLEPIKYVNSDGVISGLNPDLLRAAGRILGTEAIFQEGPFDGFIPGLQAGRFDAIASIADFVERQTYVDFIDYLRNGTAIITGPDFERDELKADDLCGYSIGYTRGSSQQGSLEAAAAKCAAQGRPTLTINGYGEPNAGLLSVQSGEADGFWGDAPQVIYNVEKYPDRYKMVYRSNTSILGIGISKNNPQFRDALRAALLKLVEDGIYNRILEHWNLEEAALPEMDINTEMTMDE